LLETLRIAAKEGTIGFTELVAWPLFIGAILSRGDYKKKLSNIHLTSAQ
jgi:hypothetical protein